MVKTSGALQLRYSGLLQQARSQSDVAMLPAMDISPGSSDTSLLPPPSAFQMPLPPKPPSPDQAPSEASTPPRPSRWGNCFESVISMAISPYRHGRLLYIVQTSLHAMLYRCKRSCICLCHHNLLENCQHFHNMVTAPPRMPSRLYAWLLYRTIASVNRGVSSS